uniref:Uncharacterized protein n=1 Tax=Anguilla anguilla TaxID=7936 RepID=A0A0E9T698_ANGAN
MLFFSCCFFFKEENEMMEKCSLGMRIKTIQCIFPWSSTRHKISQKH